MYSRIRQLLTYMRRYREDKRQRKKQHARNIERMEFLSRFIVRQGTGAELGVHKGYFSPVLFDRLAPEKLYLIDPWYLQGKQWSWGEGNRRVMDALCRVLRQMEDELVSGKVVLLIDDDLEALAKMPDGHLDWVYLDTTHQYEHTVKELRLLKLKLKPGGVIAGDDWQTDRSHKHYTVLTSTMGCAGQCESSLIARTTPSFVLTRKPISGLSVHKKRVKTGGTQVGTPNKPPAEREREIRQSGLTPLDGMLKVLGDKKAPLRALDRHRFITSPLQAIHRQPASRSR